MRFARRTIAVDEEELPLYPPVEPPRIPEKLDTVQSIPYPVTLLSRDELQSIVADAVAAGARRVIAERVGPDELLTVAETARRLGVSPRAVSHYVASGELARVELPATSATGTGRRRVLRIRASAVEALIRRGEQRHEADEVIDLAVARAARRQTRPRRGRGVG